jgi:hypothetical protein
VCAIVTGFLLKCWGDNGNSELGLYGLSQIGTGATDMGDNLPFVSLGTNVKVLRVSLGGSLSCVLTNANQIKCFGYNAYGELGQGSTSNIPSSSTGQMGDYLPYIELGTGYSAIGIFAGFNFACVILDNQKVKCWGANEHGELGICSTTDIGKGSTQMGDALQFVNECPPTSAPIPVPTPNPTTASPTVPSPFPTYAPTFRPSTASPTHFPTSKPSTYKPSTGSPTKKKKKGKKKNHSHLI